MKTVILALSVLFSSIGLHSLSAHAYTGGASCEEHYRKLGKTEEEIRNVYCRESNNVEDRRHCATNPNAPDCAREGDDEEDPGQEVGDGDQEGDEGGDFGGDEDGGGDDEG